MTTSQNYDSIDSMTLGRPWEPVHRCRSSRFHLASQSRLIFTQWVWKIRHRGWLISLSEISEIAVWNGESDKIYMLINFTTNVDRPRFQGVPALRPEKSARPRCVQTQLCQPTLLARGFPQRRVYARSVLQVRQQHRPQTQVSFHRRNRVQPRHLADDDEGEPAPLYIRKFRR